MGHLSFLRARPLVCNHDYAGCGQTTVQRGWCRDRPLGRGIDAERLLWKDSLQWEHYLFPFVATQRITKRSPRFKERLGGCGDGGMGGRGTVSQAEPLSQAVICSAPVLGQVLSSLPVFNGFNVTQLSLSDGRQDNWAEASEVILKTGNGRYFCWLRSNHWQPSGKEPLLPHL